MTDSVYLAHCEDPDGIIGRALLLRGLGREYETGEHRFIRYDRIVEGFDVDVTDKEVYVVDIGPGTYLSQSELLKNWRNNVKSATWFDHHQGWGRADVGWMNFRFDTTKCAALQVALHFDLMGNEYDSRLARIAQASDFRNSVGNGEVMEMACSLERVIAYANASLDYSVLKELSVDLIEEKTIVQGVLAPKWKGVVDEVEREIGSISGDFSKSIEYDQINDYRVASAHVPAILGAKQGPLLMREHAKGADLMLCLYEAPHRNHLLLRRRGGVFDVIEFTQMLGGGGRDDGGGFATEYDISSEMFVSEKERILDLIGRFNRF